MDARMKKKQKNLKPLSFNCYVKVGNQGFDWGSLYLVRPQYCSCGHCRNGATVSLYDCGVVLNYSGRRLSKNK